MHSLLALFLLVGSCYGITKYTAADIKSRCWTDGSQLCDLENTLSAGDQAEINQLLSKNVGEAIPCHEEDKTTPRCKKTIKVALVDAMARQPAGLPPMSSWLANVTSTCTPCESVVILMATGKHLESLFRPGTEIGYCLGTCLCESFVYRVVIPTGLRHLYWHPHDYKTALKLMIEKLQEQMLHNRHCPERVGYEAPDTSFGCMRIDEMKMKPALRTTLAVGYEEKDGRATPNSVIKVHCRKHGRKTSKDLLVCQNNKWVSYALGVEGDLGYCDAYWANDDLVIKFRDSLMAKLDDSVGTQTDKTSKRACWIGATECGLSTAAVESGIVGGKQMHTGGRYPVKLLLEAQDQGPFMTFKTEVGENYGSAENLHWSFMQKVYALIARNYCCKNQLLENLLAVVMDSPQTIPDLSKYGRFSSVEVDENGRMRQIIDKVGALQATCTMGGASCQAVGYSSPAEFFSTYGFLLKPDLVELMAETIMETAGYKLVAVAPARTALVNPYAISYYGYVEDKHPSCKIESVTGVVYSGKTTVSEPVGLFEEVPVEIRKVQGYLELRKIAKLVKGGDEFGGGVGSVVYYLLYKC
jgi:hypothetical protein